MRLKIWGARGSVPAPGPETIGYGGNTSCVQVTLDDGTQIVLDAGTGIRGLGVALKAEAPLIHILLTHLHLDHIQGLVFFAPAFRPTSKIMVWGPSSPEGSLEDRIARYISAPLSAIEVRELPCDVSFLDAPDTEWSIGGAQIRAGSVAHRGPTLGYRITEGDTSLTYISDHEPSLGTPLDSIEPDWISGYELAHDASLLIHDCQYTDDEYPLHEGWGHSSVSDSLLFAQRVAAHRVLLFHHDPMHTDAMLDAIGEAALERWRALGGDPDQIEMAIEGEEFDLQGADTDSSVAPAAAGR
ncbi:MAG TPA: MBL fold metallo-hydrolase [Solirubrobacteraceae bacterium]|nr:MBL fold metallo-hydrolase [Solirubrobacteraceae bacterium]